MRTLQKDRAKRCVYIDCQMDRWMIHRETEKFLEKSFTRLWRPISFMKGRPKIGDQVGFPVTQFQSEGPRIRQMNDVTLSVRGGPENLGAIVMNWRVQQMGHLELGCLRAGEKWYQLQIDRRFMLLPLLFVWSHS